MGRSCYVSSIVKQPKCNQIGSQTLSHSLVSSPETEDKVKGGLLLDVVVGEGPSPQAAFQRRSTSAGPGGCPPCPGSWHDVLDGVGGLNFKSDGLASQGLDEDLHTSPETEDKVESGLLLDVVVGEGPSVLKLLASEDQPLLVRGDALLVLDLGLDVLDGVGGLYLKGDGLASQGLDEDLHTSPKTEDKVEGGLLLDVVVEEGPSVLELLASEDQPLLVWGDALLVLDLGLDVFDGVGGLDLKGAH